MGGAAKAPPPFPVVAPPKTGKTAPPIPHITAKEEPVIPEENVPEAKVPVWKKGFFKYAILAVLLFGSVAYRFVRDSLVQATSDTIRDKMTHKAEPAKTGGSAAVPGAAPKAATPAAAPNPALANKPAQPTPGLSETQNAIAHAPVNAVNKAKDVIGKREGSGQGRDAVGAITDGEAPASAKPAAHQTVTISSAIAPGVSATNADVAAAAEASPAFRSFVANAKINGVFGHDEGARTTLNGRLVRFGDVVETGLGITFNGYDYNKRQLIFKDKAGATVTRRYP
jgi:hypothetical protein